MKAAQQVNIQEVWEEFFTNRNLGPRNILIEHYLPIVKYTAERIHTRLPKNVDLNDLISAGIFGLIAAIDRFDPKINAKFETYCVQRVRGFILDEIRKNDWIPRLVRARARKLTMATQKLQALLGRTPNEKEIAEELQLDMRGFYHLQRDANAIGLISLSSKLSDSDGNRDMQRIDIIQDKSSQNPFDEAVKRDMKEFVTKGFSRADKLILTLYYGEEMTMKEVGKSLGISESRVSQKLSSILARLRAHMKQEHSHCLLEMGVRT